MTGDPNNGVDEIPSNVELSDRTIRMEQELGEVSETVQRIENRLTDDYEELEETVEEHDEKVETLWTYHQVFRFALPLLGALGSLIAGLVALGIIG